ncbi:iron dicitrate transport regulator FecR [Niastella yeongjuensis]|uniref:Iron dicitrate transport regulator FecR n=1 Tax=Niastella yeongjuensis TaxID=354355 RepID=A0A1V9E9I4_9BACT|nr:FecR family protein [Niastella yeongjuensis]OQP42787.1 iron dicitrate transport regulator FecR [Niastella yeongjuensis]SEO53972.1 FecR family protein [Niastella yeongjuensis]
MATDSQHIIYLLGKYSSGQATSSEVDQLLTLLRTENHDETVVSFIEDQLGTFEPDNTEDIAFWKNRLKGGAQQITGVVADANDSVVVDIPGYARPVHRVHFLRKWGWAAASIILALGLGVYLLATKTNKTLPPANVVQAAEIAPGKNGAVLTLADGSRVVLDSLGNGVVATQNGAQVVLKGGALAYDASNTASGEVTYNTMSTPKGRQFQVTLPDGTKVWLNAASSLRYPTAFTGEARKVTVTGEAYFEVAHNRQKPFIVTIPPQPGGLGGAEVTVLGTHFNINAYENENAIHTTLLQGSVRVAKGRRQRAEGKEESVVLKPGQQTILSQTSQLSQPIPVQTAEVIAWKNGLFNFEGASLGEIMRQLERWYDIEVSYQKGIPDVEFEGKMTRDVPLGDLLTMLERSDIHFKVEGRKLIVLP